MGSIANILAGAKNALGKANKAFPSSMAPAKPAVAAPKAAAPAPKTSSVGDELRVKAANIKQYTDNTPKMHNGGPVVADGTYQLKAGEHILTADEAKRARKHALMFAGMKSLTKSGKGKKS